MSTEKTVPIAAAGKPKHLWWTTVHHLFSQVEKRYNFPGHFRPPFYNRHRARACVDVMRRRRRRPGNTPARKQRLV